MEKPPNSSIEKPLTHFESFKKNVESLKLAPGDEVVVRLIYTEYGETPNDATNIDEEIEGKFVRINNELQGVVIETKEDIGYPDGFLVAPHQYEGCYIERKDTRDDRLNRNKALH